MILIATPNASHAHVWQSALADQYPFYEKTLQEKRALVLCLKKVKCDLLLLDLALLTDDGIHELSELLDLQPKTHVILLTDKPDEREEISVILFGAKAYLNTQVDAMILQKAVAKVLTHEVWVDRQFLTRLLAEIQDITRARRKEAKQLDDGVRLMTPRESEIATLIATGASNRSIAERLSISERTVKAHLGVIFRKIGLTDRLQLALYMNRHEQLANVWRARPPTDPSR